MGEFTKIQWCDYTFNPWRGCTKISAGCANCYAEAQAKRNPAVLGVWGSNGTRAVAAESYWRQPERWNRQAESDHAAILESHETIDQLMPGHRKTPYVRPRVFCASMADVFEDWHGTVLDTKGRELRRCEYCGRLERGCAFGECRVCDPPRTTVLATLNDVRARLFRLIDATPSLDWLLVTKRPENIRRMWHRPWRPDEDDPRTFDGHRIVHRDVDPRRPNVWLLASIEDQATADQRIPRLIESGGFATVLGLSIEPLLGPIDLSRWFTHPPRGSLDVVVGPVIDWVIVGGESGANARPCLLPYMRSIIRQCNQAGVPCFVKQLGSAASDEQYGIAGRRLVVPEEALPLVSHRLQDSKGGEPAEWPDNLRVREFPTLYRMG